MIKYNGHIIKKMRNLSKMVIRNAFLPGVCTVRQFAFHSNRFDSILYHSNARCDFKILLYISKT